MLDTIALHVGRIVIGIGLGFVVTKTLFKIEDSIDDFLTEIPAAREELKKHLSRQ